MSDKIKIILTVFLSITFLYTGWVTGSSLGYQRGFAEAERQSTITHLKAENISKETEALVKVAAKARFELLIRYKNIPDRDFATIMAAHQKTSAELCDVYTGFSKNENLKHMCEDLILPRVKEVRTQIQEYLVEQGLN